MTRMEVNRREDRSRNRWKGQHKVEVGEMEFHSLKIDGNGNESDN